MEVGFSGTPAGDCVAHVPLLRWDHCSAVQERSSGAVDFPVPPFASLMRNIEQFDDIVFGLSTVEALWMDPQQRLILEVRTSAAVLIET